VATFGVHDVEWMRADQNAIDNSLVLVECEQAIERLAAFSAFAPALAESGFQVRVRVPFFASPVVAGREFWC
jgi:hypothetical protein